MCFELYTKNSSESGNDFMFSHLVATVEPSLVRWIKDKASSRSKSAAFKNSSLIWNGKMLFSLCWTQSRVVHISSVLCPPFFALAEREKDKTKQKNKTKTLQSIYILKCRENCETLTGTSQHRKYKDTPLQCECQQRWFLACRLLSFWSAQPMTAHRGRLSLRQRSWGTLLLSGRPVPEAPETTKKRKSAEVRGRWKEEE